MLTYVVQKTRAGKAMRATAQDQDAARLMGINVDRTIAFTFALGGAHGRRRRHPLPQTSGRPRTTWASSSGLIAFTAAVLGGIGNLTGAVLGGLLIGIIQGLNDGAPLRARPAVVADRRLHGPDPGHGVQTRGHAGQADDGEGVTWPLTSRRRPVAAAGPSATHAATTAKWAIGFLRRGHRGLPLLPVHPTRTSATRCAGLLPQLAAAHGGQRGPGLGDLALGLNIVVGYAGLLDLGLRRLLGDRRLHRRLADVRVHLPA